MTTGSAGQFACIPLWRFTVIRNADIRRELGHGLSDTASGQPERFVIVRTGIYAPVSRHAADCPGATRFWWPDPDSLRRPAPGQK
jgi:hypothetical protein